MERATPAEEQKSVVTGCGGRRERARRAERWARCGVKELRGRVKLTGQAEWIMWVRVEVVEGERERVGLVVGSKGMAWSFEVGEEGGIGRWRVWREAWRRESGSLPRTGQ